MAVKAVYEPQPENANGLIRIRGSEHQHLAVTRARPGERIEIFDGQGNVWDAEIVSVDRRETVARIAASRSVPPDDRQLILGQSLIRPNAFELALEKAVETGVSRVIPIVAARSNVKKDGHAEERWRRIIVEAGKQSKRYHLPVLEAPRTFAEVLEIEAPTKILFAEREASMKKPVVKGSPVLYLIGPEGGWTDEEMAAAVRHGFALVSLGSTILKSETAAAVGTFLLRNEG